MGANDLTADWGAPRRILFRFVFAYWVLYILPFPLSFLFYAAVPLPWYQDFWNTVVPWVGEQVFDVRITVLPNGSGDTTYNYVQVFCFLVLAVTVAAVWTVLDRKRLNYRRLHAGLRVYVRFYLAAMMILYGAVKVIKSQFPDPSLDRLLQPFGDASPMGLLWTFMGASASYNLFSGAGEMLGGLLLTTRRTTLLGALVSAAVLSNVAMLNFSYDVPVKLFSLHLLGMAIFLMAPDLGRLANLFLLNRRAEPVEIRPPLGRKWLGRLVVVLRTAVVIGYVGLTLYTANKTRLMYGDLARRAPLYGIWNVEEFEVEDTVRPPLVTDKDRWRRVVFDYPGMIAVQLMSDARQRYLLKIDEGKKTLALSKRDDPKWQAHFSYHQVSPGRVRLHGKLGSRRVRADLRRVPSSSFLLLNRGFHWINEYPFNR
jgi:hypothetical protein